MQPYARSLDLVCPGHLHGTGCLSARAVGTGFPTVVRLLCLGAVCGWVWVLLTPPVLAGVLGGCVWARFVVLFLFCQQFVVVVVGLRFWPAYGTCVVSCVLCLPPAVSGSGVRCGRLCWARVLAVPRPSWLGCRGVFFAPFGFFFFGFVVSVAGCPCPGPCGSSPPIPFLLGWAAGSFFFSWCVSACFGVPFPAGALFLAWCCRFWLGGPPVPLWGSCLRCLLGGGFGRLWWCWRAVWWLPAVFAPPPLPPLFFFWGGGCLFLPLPSLGWCTHWPAFSVVFRVAVGGCGLFGRVPAPWVGWAMYTLGSAPLLAGLGPGCAGWAAAPGGCVWLWVGGLGLFVSFILCAAFWVVRHRCCRARGGTVCGLRCPCVVCWCGAFRGVRWLASVSPSG